MSAKVIRISGALVDGHVTAKSELAFQVAALLAKVPATFLDYLTMKRSEHMCQANHAPPHNGLNCLKVNPNPPVPLSLSPCMGQSCWSLTPHKALSKATKACLIFLLDLF